MLLGLSIKRRGKGLYPLPRGDVGGLMGRGVEICLGTGWTVEELGLGCLAGEGRGCGGLHNFVSGGHCMKPKHNKLFPNFSVRSSGGLWSPLPGLPLFPRRSSAGERTGPDGVNHKSENGSCRTCASDREGSNACRARDDSCSNSCR